MRGSRGDHEALERRIWYAIKVHLGEALPVPTQEDQPASDRRTRALRRAAELDDEAKRILAQAEKKAAELRAKAKELREQSADEK